TSGATAAINGGSTMGTDDARIVLTAANLTGTAVLNDNKATASATANWATNILTAEAGTEMLNLGNSTTITTNIGLAANTAGFALQNIQMGTADIYSSVTNLDIETGLTSLDGIASVDNNTVLSQSRGQVAQSSLVLNAGTTLNCSASLANAQINEGAISSAINPASTAGNIGLTVSNINGAVSVDNNKVQASSTANLAMNSMNIAGALAASDGGSAGTLGQLTATADYVALNAQRNQASVSSVVRNYNIALNSAASTLGTASVSGNTILADATGNSATNTFTITPKVGFNTADFAFTGYQFNTGNTISSSISNASIGLTSGGGTGTFSATGNRIGATAVGNVSVSTIRSGK
ncbi:MAG: hypothetical protein JW943_14235, partial [Deltaproteobacteria bacterium]|nr:hypothetical protein [Deltaproteobacteria bacterium]